ncbi:MAG: zf-HC2 domain-containing protein [candidate division Zixibacteria bacterium]|nr:zf-HC2 domain-containing protein [candidate division Zixibacteria bacterium]
MGKLKCEDFDRLLHLYFDGELKGKEFKEIEEHLLSCQRCAEKLQELKSLDEKVKKIKMPEPSGTYWKIFTEEVRNKIILSRKKSFWAKLKSGWESFFYYSPAKLRIAAGIASVLLVFIIGKLYWDYKGKELEQYKSDRMEKILSSQVPKKVEYTAPAIKESTQVGNQIKESTIVEQKSPLPEEKAQDKTKKEAGRGKIIVPESTITVTAERPKIEKGVIENLRIATQAEIAIKPPSVPETTIQVQKSPEEKDILKITAERALSTAKMDKKLSTSEGRIYYMPVKSWVRALNENDTTIDTDTLKKVIISWKEYFEKKPVSEWAPEGITQIEIAYQLLFLKTKDEVLLHDGIELLKKYEESVIDQKIKDELNKNIEKLEALKKK